MEPRVSLVGQTDPHEINTWEDTLATDTSDKGPWSKIHKALAKLNSWLTPDSAVRR